MSAKNSCWLCHVRRNLGLFYEMAQNLTTNQTGHKYDVNSSFFKWESELQVVVDVKWSLKEAKQPKLTTYTKQY